MSDTTENPTNECLRKRIAELTKTISVMHEEMIALGNRFANIIPTLQRDTEYATKSVMELAETLGHNSERLQEMRAAVEKVSKRSDRLWQALNLALNGGDDSAGESS